jgi:hypothetical protein
MCRVQTGLTAGPGLRRTTLPAKITPTIWALTGLAVLLIPAGQIILHRTLAGCRSRTVTVRALQTANHCLLSAAAGLWHVFAGFPDSKVNPRVDLLLVVPAGLLTLFLWAIFVMTSGKSFDAQPGIWKRGT